jgi:hypothetical protein
MEALEEPLLLTDVQCGTEGSGNGAASGALEEALCVIQLVQHPQSHCS